MLRFRLVLYFLICFVSLPLSIFIPSFVILNHSDFLQQHHNLIILQPYLFPKIPNACLIILHWLYSHFKLQISSLITIRQLSQAIVIIPQLISIRLQFNILLLREIQLPPQSQYLLFLLPYLTPLLLNLILQSP